MMDLNVDLFQRFISFLIKETSGGGIKNKNMSDQQLTEELYKPVNRIFEKRKVYSRFIDNIWGVHFADMKFYLYYVLLIFSVNPHGPFFEI